MSELRHHALERRLEELGREIAFPAAPDVSAAVTARLETAPARPLLRRRQGALVLALVAAALAGVLAVSDGARSAFLDLFRIGGAEISRVERLPEPGAHDELADAELVATAEGERRAGFRLRFPDGARPERVYLATLEEGVAVIAVLEGDDPVHLSQFAGSGLTWVRKWVRSETATEPVLVHGDPGLWVPGTHVVAFGTPAGGIANLPTRLAGNTLLWEREGVTYRLEGDLTLDRALALARSVR